MSEKKLITVEDYEKAAAKKLDRMAFDYFSAGADGEKTLKRNRKAFKKYELWYRVLVDVSEVTTRTTVLGKELSSPLVVAPTAYQKLAHPEGECATAAAAADAGTAFILSTLATTSLEEVAASSAGTKWFQLYVHKDRGFTKDLVQKAEAAGYEAIFLTVDAPILGRRVADERNGFALPEGMTMENLTPGETYTATEGSMLTAFAADRHDATLGWGDIEWLRSITSLPVVIKGLVRPDDAEKAVSSGADGVVVSNHGGRQLDYSPASIDALAAVADAVGDRTTLMVDGGFRWGSEVLIALALGADAVLLGRPVLWGLAVGGREGVAQILELLRAELVTAMTLAGVASIDAIDRSLVRPAFSST